MSRTLDRSERGRTCRYSANLVPQMIEMGIDVWQGALSVNDIPALIKKYGDKISIMGGIDNGILDRAELSCRAALSELPTLSFSREFSSFSDSQTRRHMQSLAIF